ncbi:unnamed protein product [Lactuca saligna]|uniref:Uncharacterized protein n=1 Tax=Lactuca saligna TaxID=75948 RepID=A0AA35YVX5_LACSI|nr:unnamed protein product [Lactuca saligna]
MPTSPSSKKLRATDMAKHISKKKKKKGKMIISSESTVDEDETIPETPEANLNKETSALAQTAVIPPKDSVAKSLSEEARTSDILVNVSNTDANVIMGEDDSKKENQENAFFEFKTALELAQKIKDPIEEKKAARGLGASMQRQGKHREAIKYHSMVLSVSEREGEDSGNTEAYGAIADCYTELGDLEKAATFYDQYIARLQAD